MYKISFFKNLLSSDGHQFRCLQGAVEIRRARTVDRAVRAAQRHYERLHRPSFLSAQADEIEVEIDGKKIEYRAVRGQHINYSALPLLKSVRRRCRGDSRI